MADIFHEDSVTPGPEQGERQGRRRSNNLIAIGLENGRFRGLLMTWIPVTLVFIVSMLALNILGPLELAVTMLLGLLGWTFLEYLLHRFVMHRNPWPARIDKAVEGFLPHRTHHKKPEDPEIEIIEKPLKPFLLGVVFALYFCLYAPWPYAFAFTIGGALGYVGYEVVHFATHKVTMPRGFMGHWHRQHMLHHYRDDTRNYGVTTPIWDFVFRTYHRPQPNR